MGKVPTRQVSAPGRLRVSHLRMSGGRRRKRLLDLRCLEARQFGEAVAQPMGEDHQHVPGARLLRHFEVGKGPDPALRPLPQVCNRHRRIVKQGGRF